MPNIDINLELSILIFDEFSNKSDLNLIIAFGLNSLNWILSGIISDRDDFVISAPILFFNYFIFKTVYLNI